MATIGFVHTVLSLPATFAALAEELAPEAESFHVVDESLLTVTRKGGSLTPLTSRRVLDHILSAADAGADVVVVTCSSVGPAVDASRPFTSVPVVRIDEAVADEAVRRGPRVGVLATLKTTLEPTAELVDRRGRAAGSPVTVVPVLCEGAFEALAAGDREAHDQLVLEGLRRLSDDVDVVVLAQASMARVADELPRDEQRVAVLSSPRLGMLRVAELVARPGALNASGATRAS
jgi:Asp/Glu/hydantoin racemase